MATGDTNNIISRLKSVLPAWWSQTSPILDAVLSAFGSVASWAYAVLQYCILQTRLGTATDSFLDLASYDFFGPRIRRFLNEADAAFRTRIRKEVTRPRVSRGAISTALTDLTSKAPILFEPWNTGDTGAWDAGGFVYAGSNPATGGGGGWDAGSGYDVNSWLYDSSRSYAAITSGGLGGWGDTNLPGQFFVTAYRPGLQGIPSVSGFDSVGGGWDAGALAYIDMSMISGAVTDADIYNTINSTRAAGTLAWTQLQ